MATVIGFEPGNVGRRVESHGSRLVLRWYCGRREHGTHDPYDQPCRHETREAARDCRREHEERTPCRLGNP